MSRRDDAALLDDILRYACQAQAFSRGRGRPDLDHDAMFREALIRELEVVGEAVARLSPAWTAARPGVPWSDWVGLRNRLIHGYFAVDLDIVWTIVEDDLPVLVRSVEEALGATAGELAAAGDSARPPGARET